MAGNLSIEEITWIFNLNVKLTNVNIWEEPSILYYILYNILYTVYVLLAHLVYTCMYIVYLAKCHKFSIIPKDKYLPLQSQVFRKQSSAHHYLFYFVLSVINVIVFIQILHQKVNSYLSCSIGPRSPSEFTERKNDPHIYTIVAELYRRLKSELD